MQFYGKIILVPNLIVFEKVEIASPGKWNARLRREKSFEAENAKLWSRDQVSEDSSSIQCFYVWHLKYRHIHPAYALPHIGFYSSAKLLPYTSQYLDNSIEAISFQNWLETLADLRPNKCRKVFPILAVVVAQLVERSLPTPEICGSNPNIGKIISTNCTIENRKDTNKENKDKKRPVLAHLKKKDFLVFMSVGLNITF